MTWISLVCLLVLSGSAFGGYGSNYGGASVGQVPKLISMMLDRPAPRPIISQGYGQVQQPQPVDWSSSVQQDLPIPTSAYGSSIPKTLPTQGYGQSYGAVPQFDQPIPQVQVLTPADQLCRGQRPETVIPIEDSRKFVVCLDDSKGVEQQCPKGLFYHPTSLRCERKLGPLENVCASQPCLNGGQCIPTDSSYQCQCAPGFDGRTCELDARVCQTQYPCGQSADAKCQSFRLGAALQYICIFQDGYAYGLSTSQVVPSPCQDTDGPQALAITRNGFIMCDGERMHIESCPGGTLWDDLTKACVWPDMEVIPQQDQYSYGQQPKVLQPSYGAPQFEKPRLIPSGYGSPMEVIRTQPRHHHHHHHHAKIFNTYGNKMIVPQQFEQPKSTYGAQLEQPKVFQPTYGAQLEQPKVIQPTYGAQLEQPKVIQPTYGAQLEQPKVIQPTYGAQWSVPKFEKPKLIESSYGSQQLKPQEDLVSIKQTSAY